MVKQGFKFLNTLSFGLQNKVMLHIRQAHQIGRAIIVLYSIQVMDNPTFGQGFPMYLFPDKNMLKHIYTPVACPRMSRSINHNISPIVYPSALPTMMLVSPCCLMMLRRIFSRTTPTKFGTSRLSTFFAWVFAQKSSIPLVFNSILFVFIWHNLIIPYFASRCEYTRYYVPTEELQEIIPITERRLE